MARDAQILDAEQSYVRALDHARAQIAFIDTLSTTAPAQLEAIAQLNRDTQTLASAARILAARRRRSAERPAVLDRDRAWDPQERSEILAYIADLTGTTHTPQEI